MTCWSGLVRKCSRSTGTTTTTEVGKCKTTVESTTCGTTRTTRARRTLLKAWRSRALEVLRTMTSPQRWRCAPLWPTSLSRRGNRKTSKPLAQGWKKAERQEPRRIGDPPPSLGEFIKTQPRGCFLCYWRSTPFQHDHWQCAVHKADNEAYNQAHGSKRRTPTNIRETAAKVAKGELSKLKEDLA